jgi:hypothetical protein
MLSKLTEPGMILLRDINLEQALDLVASASCLVVVALEDAVV